MSLRNFFNLSWARPKKSPLHFLHIRKTGGTAVISALQPFMESGRYRLVIHGHETRFNNVPPGERIIFFLRHPVTRFVSGFNSRLRQGRPRVFNPWSPEEKVIFEQFPTPNRLALALNSESPAERAAAEKAMHAIRHLPAVCQRWFGGQADLQARLPDVFFIGFQETLAADFDRLKAKLRLPADIALPTDEVAAHKTPEHLDKKLEPQAVENLRRWYADDIRFYEFCQQLVAENKVG